MQNLFRRVSIEMIAVLALAVVSLPTQATAQVSYFLQISGVPGESADTGHTGWIDVSMTSIAVVAPQQQPFHFTTGGPSIATPALFLAAASGQHFSTATLAIRRGPNQNPDYLKYIMTDVVVTSDAVGGSTGASPSEQFNLNYSTLQIEYRQQRPDGSYGPPIVNCWDFVASAPCG